MAVAPVPRLTPTERQILHLLRMSGDWVRGYVLAASACQGSTNRIQADSLIRWHISHIRRKLGHSVILTSKGQGYRINSEARMTDVIKCPLCDNPMVPKEHQLGPFGKILICACCWNGKCNHFRLAIKRGELPE